jgi:hypothetical protein
MKLHSSPWGGIQHQKELAPGIVEVSTASHGGIYLDDDRWSALKAMFPMVQPWAGAGWLEEDCDWAIAALAFPFAFDTKSQIAAEDTVRNWHPEVWEKYKGRALLPGESMRRDEDTFYAANVGKMASCAAWGDWQKGVPSGFVGLCARPLRARKDTRYIAGDDRYYLVPEAEYDKRGGQPFLIQPHHVEVANFTLPVAA